MSAGRALAHWAKSAPARVSPCRRFARPKKATADRSSELLPANPSRISIVAHLITLINGLWRIFIVLFVPVTAAHHFPLPLSASRCGQGE
jgi:hypothetical protein